MDADIGCTPPSQRDDRCNLRIIDAKGLAAPRDHDRLAWKTRPNFLQVIHCQPFDDRTGLHCCGRWAIVGEAGRDDHLVSHLAKQGASFHAGVLGRRESTRTVQIEHYRLVVVRSVPQRFFIGLVNGCSCRIEGLTTSKHNCDCYGKRRYFHRTDWVLADRQERYQFLNENGWQWKWRSSL